MAMICADDFTDDDTDVAPAPHERREKMVGEPSYELVWVEEDGYGMVLRVRPLTKD